MVEVTEELARAVEGTRLLGGSHSRDAIVRAVLPIVEAQRQVGVQQGLDMAAGVAERLSNGAIFSEADREATCLRIRDAISKLGGEDGTD